MLRIGWFSTGRGQGSIGLLKTAMEAIGSKELDAEITFVFCNREAGEHQGSDEFIALAQSYNLPLVTLSSKQFREQRHLSLSDFSRELYDSEIMNLLHQYECDVSVLAGYMLIVGPTLCKRYKMLNLHPALPEGPSGTWRDVIWKLIATNASEHGVMIHLVTEILDEGPPIAYARFPIRGGPFDALWDTVQGTQIEALKTNDGEELPLFQAIRNEGLKIERPLLKHTLIRLSNGLLKIPDNPGLSVRSSTPDPIDITNALD